MNILASQVTIINAPIESVFTYVTDLTHFGEWFPGVNSITAVNDSENQAGKCYQENFHLPLLGNKQVTITVMSIRKPYLFITEGNLKILLPRMQIQFKPIDAQTQVTWEMSSRNQGRFFRSIIRPLITPIVQRRAKKGLQQLNAHLGKSHTLI